MFDDLKIEILEDEITKSWFDPRIIEKLKDEIKVVGAKPEEMRGMLTDYSFQQKTLKIARSYPKEFPPKVQEFFPTAATLYGLLGYLYFHLQGKDFLKVFNPKIHRVIEKCLPYVRDERIPPPGELRVIFESEFGKNSPLIPDADEVVGKFFLIMYRSAIGGEDVISLLDRYLKRDLAKLSCRNNDTRATAVSYLFANEKEGKRWECVRDLLLMRSCNLNLKLSPYLAVWYRNTPRIALERFGNFELGEGH